jgi:hypothetical protein
MSVALVVSYCLIGFGIGYAGGSIIRIARKAVESCE